MIIGIDARLWNETGVGRYIRSLFHNLNLLDKENEYVWFFRQKEFESIDLPNPKWKKVLADVRWHTLKEQIILPWIFYKENLDLLHFPYFSFPIFYPKKFIVTIHDLIFDHYKTGKTSTLPPLFYLIKKIGYRLVLWTSINRAKAIITLSKDAKNEIVDHYKANPQKIIVTYESGLLEDKRNNFKLSQFQNIRTLQPFILYVGNAHPHKNVESLIHAMEYIKKEKKDWKLVLVGSDNFFYPRLEEYIKKSTVADSIIPIGEVPNTELGVWYRFAKAFVTASKMEGFGIPPLEAMSVGCPVIVSDIPVFHEIYSDAAVYFNQNNPPAIARVILETVNNKKRIDQLIQQGHQRSKMYSWEKMVEETVRIYQKVLKGVRP